MVRRLLENSFMSLSISCFISGGRLANSSELMSTELGSSYNSPLSLEEKHFVVTQQGSSKKQAKLIYH